VDLIKKYWDEKFDTEGEVWGDDHNNFAEVVAQKFNNKGMTLLDIGCGYGRDSCFFYELGFIVHGIDISEIAIAMAQTDENKIHYKIGDIRKLEYEDNCFDIAFSHSVLHLFDEIERKIIINEIYRVLKDKAVFCLCVSSVNDADFGNGKMIERNTFINTRGVVKHYFTEDEIRLLLCDFSKIEISEEKIYHVHDSAHVHSNFNIIATK